MSTLLYKFKKRGVKVMSNLSTSSTLTKIGLKKEESEILEKAESLRQLVLSSSLKHEQILRIDTQLDGLIFNISQKYDTKYQDFERVGNV
jgi:hypothetical protein